MDTDTRARVMLLMSEDVNRTPLDAISLDDAEKLVHEVFNREHGEPTVGVARFGSSI